jgi:hypothetical protein
MPKPLLPLTVAAPGFLGLNTQKAGSVLPMGWATVLSNVSYDDVGRIASRKGSQQQNGTVIPNTPTIQAAHEYVDSAGVRVRIIAADNKIFKEVAGTVTDVSGTITTPSADNWQFVNFNDWCVGFQEGHAPIVATSATTPVFSDSGGTQYDGKMGASAYGRLWTVYQNTLYYSDLLINDFTGGSSGNFDLSKYWPHGMDEATAVVDFNGYLLVFGEESILVYENADDVDNMALIEGVGGIGCIARDSIQTIGKDIVFLSSSGLRSFGRTVTKNSMPLTDISTNVRDSLMAAALVENADDIQSVYNKDDGFYLITLPAKGLSYSFDLKFPNEDGTWKASTWDMAPTALLYTTDNTMYLAVDDGYFSKYTGFRDGDDNVASGGSAYDLVFEGVWNDFGQVADGVGNNIKMLKSFSLLGAGTPAAPVTIKWAVDYSEVFSEQTVSFNENTPSQYGIAQYGIDAYAASGTFERRRSTMGRAGQVVKIGVETSISGNAFALQRLDILAKVGRLAL